MGATATTKAAKNDSAPAVKAKKPRAPRKLKSVPPASSAASSRELTNKEFAASSPGPAVDVAELRKAIRMFGGVIDAKATMPMLQRVLVRAVDGERFAIVGTDLTMSMTVELHGSWGADPDGISISARNLCDACKALPDGAAKIASTRSLTVIDVDDTTISLVSDTGRDFPKVATPSDKVQWHAIDAAVLRDLIDATLFSVCRDETRFHLAGVLVESTGEILRMVSTDGHRLSKAQRAGVCGLVTPSSLIVPADAMREIRRFVRDGAVEIAIETKGTRHTLFVRQGAVTFSVKTIDAAFPPYQQVIPQEHRRQVAVDRNALIKACKRAGTLCSDTRGIRLELGDGLVLRADDPDVGELRVTIPAIYWEKHRGYCMGVNPSFLIDACERIAGDRVVLNMESELDPILVRSVDDATMREVLDAETLYVVMPMRI